MNAKQLIQATETLLLTVRIAAEGGLLAHTHLLLAVRIIAKGRLLTEALLLAV